MHDYYSYTAEEMAANAKIPVQCMASSEEVYRTLAREMADAIIGNNTKGLQTKLILPVGPVGQYPFFIDLVNAEKISLKDCWFFNMDEYLTDDKEWVDKNHRLSFRGFMERVVYAKISKDLVNPPEQRIFPDPDNPSLITETLDRMGGADICFGGIGINGHLAFNEAQGELTPEELGKLPTRVITISAETRTTNAIGDLGGAIDEMPTYAVTIGMYEIVNSKKVRLSVIRDWHRAVVRRAVCGEVEASFPVTLLQGHPDSRIYVNDIASERAL